MLMYSEVIDVQMIAKLARGIFACVARDAMIENERLVSLAGNQFWLMLFCRENLY